MKRIFVSLFTLFIILFSPSNAWAQGKGQVLIINQVRGEECCSVGSIKHLKMQVDSAIEYRIPSHFAIRYDALQDERYVSLLLDSARQYPELIHVGILLEIIPQLAKQAGVKYKGTAERWYEAQNVFSIGYTDEENILIADEVFNNFKSTFGSYPELTAGWMIDTVTLEYIHSTYGVKMHQITREQWGTDSYTLTGGPPHYPYPSSEQWAMIPDYERGKGPLIVRQTVTDPLYNYGDTKNAFTSQPNDYANDKKSFSYFETLITQALKEQTQTGFALLGLENSMGNEFQTEYKKQLEFVSTLAKDNTVTFPSITELSTYWRAYPMSVYGGGDTVADSDNRAYWITTPNYRVRLRTGNGHVFISDIRIYNTSFDDPYKTIQGKKEGFWIVPYVLDGSLWHTKPLQKNTLLSKSLPDIHSIFPEPRYDVDSDSSRIDLPPISSKPKVEQTDDTITFSYNTDKNKPIKINFNMQNIELSGISKDTMTYVPRLPETHPLSYSKLRDGWKLQWSIDDHVSHEVIASCKSTSCLMNFSSTDEYLSDMREKQYPYIFPEPIARKLSSTLTEFRLHNQFAIAGRNPVRVIVIPYDQYGIPTILDKKITTKTDISLRVEHNVQDTIYYVDLYGDTPHKTNVVVQLPQGIESQKTIYFAPNCKESLSQCIGKPQFMWWYIQTVVRDKLRLYLDNEQQ